MDTAALLERVRRAAGLTQDELARRAGTSRTAVSAYEHGRKSPTLATATRLLAESGFELDVVPRIEFVRHPVGRGRVVRVPTGLPRLPVAQALATVTLPLHVNWSTPGRRFQLADRAQRARVYEMVIREGNPEDVLAYIDGVLLVDLWPELVLPRAVRAAWNTVVSAATPEAA
jgi:transcriptional regulator with XRE-family HTH domain